jgi:ketosteroid isomerase-like protein
MLTDEQRSAIKDSIKAVIVNVNKAAEEVDADRLVSYLSKSDNIRFIDQDAKVMYPYDSIHIAWKKGYSGLLKQVIQPSEPFINVLTPDYAIVTNVTDFTATVKDSTTVGGPVAWTLLFVRESGQWKILNGHQSIKWREPSTQKMK